jgi:hypothetical protein
MTGRDGTKGNNRRRMSIVGGAVGAFAAAAAMATGSAVTAAPAKADIDALLDPIIQPIITSLSDAIVGFDPAAAADLTSWTDSLLTSLNSLDVALPASAEPASALAAADSPSGTYDIPLTVQEGTEPTVNVSVDGSTPEATLVDTGSSGLVIPSTDLSLTQWFDLGFPTGISESGYSGGIQYLYLTYDNASVDYGGVLTTPNTPLDVEFLSWPTSFSAGAPVSFQEFLADNDSPGGILGIGDAADAGPGTSPFEAFGSTGVTVDIPQSDLVVGANEGANGLQLTPIATLAGAPTVNNNLTETVTSGGTTIGSGLISDDVDSGGVFGTIPSTIDPSTLAPGDVVTVSDNGTTLYSYIVGQNAADGAPLVTTGTAGTNAIDSGFAPYNEEPIYISYGGTDGAITFDKPLT